MAAKVQGGTQQAQPPPCPTKHPQNHTRTLRGTSPSSLPQKPIWERARAQEFATCSPKWLCLSPGAVQGQALQAACCPRQPRAGHSHHVSPWQRGHHIAAWGQHSHGEGDTAATSHPTPRERQLMRLCHGTRSRDSKRFPCAWLSSAACAGSSNFFFCPVIKWKKGCYIDWAQAGGFCQPMDLAADAGTSADISAHQVRAGPAVNALLAPCTSPAAQSGIAQGHPITVL